MLDLLLFKNGLLELFDMQFVSLLFVLKLNRPLPVLAFRELHPEMLILELEFFQVFGVSLLNELVVVLEH